ncbi:uncharacterized protein LOC124276410 [Haliotis rubra]|uniref:uncharacterized protein LOC124276410 n=1 Tax=Haliotis rubra TaxID=36100 RepID=UPI001EE592B5|nr:uncharacterized protein LOC124276410 [Haliotis rubra]
MLYVFVSVAAIAGGVGAGLLMLLVVVAVATLCYRRVSSVPENITGNELQGREESSSEEANGQPVSITSPVDNDIVSAITDLSTHSPTNHRASSGSYTFTNYTFTNDHLGCETQNRSLSDNYNTVTFQSAVHPSQRSDPHIPTGEKHDHHSYDYLRRTRPGFTSDVDGDTLPPLYNESHVCQIESSDIYNHLRRASQPPQSSVDYDTMASVAKFVDDMQSVYSYDRLKTVTGPSGV